jgi:hypothetical protein
MGRKRGGRGAAGSIHEEAAAYAAEATESERPVRKNHYLYQSKIDLAREILGVATETEALDAALDLLIYGEALAAGTEAMAGEVYHDVLGQAAEIDGSGMGAS